MSVPATYLPRSSITVSHEPWCHRAPYRIIRLAAAVNMMYRMLPSVAVAAVSAAGELPLPPLMSHTRRPIHAFHGPAAAVDVS